MASPLMKAFKEQQLYLCGEHDRAAGLRPRAELENDIKTLRAERARNRKALAAYHAMGFELLHAVDLDDVDYLTALRSALAELTTLRARVRWVPVGESLPDMNVRVDVISRSLGMVRDCTRIDLGGGEIVWDSPEYGGLREWADHADDVIAWRHIDKPEAHL